MFHALGALIHRAMKILSPVVTRGLTVMEMIWGSLGISNPISDRMIICGTEVN
jgi:hypothetical protein